MKNENILYRQPVYVVDPDDPGSGLLRWTHWGIRTRHLWETFVPPCRIDCKSEVFTGKQDCRGKKVFEGDILRYPGISAAVWVVKYNEKHASIDVSPINRRHRELLINEIGSMEVIGNVTESPDLLEDK